MHPALAKRAEKQAGSDTNINHLAFKNVEKSTTMMQSS